MELHIKTAALDTTWHLVHREDSDDRENKNEQLPDLSVDFDF